VGILFVAETATTITVKEIDEHRTYPWQVHEGKSDFPVINMTGLTDRFDFDLKCRGNDLKSHNWDTVNAALDKVGLELAPTNMPIDVLVVEKAN